MSDRYDDNKHLRCSFCGKPQSQVRRLVAGPGVYICDECVEMCMDIVEDAIRESEATTEHVQYDLPKPKDIYETCLLYTSSWPWRLPGPGYRRWL